MFDIFFSLQFAWISMFIFALSIGVAFLCARLHQQLLQVFAGEWLVQHIYCPLLRILVLVAMTLLLFPTMVSTTSYSDLTGLFMDQAYLTNMVNILMVTGLLITFLPLLNHPAVAFPTMGCIATAILFNRYFNPTGTENFSLLPLPGQAVKILVITIVVYWLGRWMIQHLSTYFDRRYIVSGSKVVVTDIVYMVMQIPVMLSYAQGLLLRNTEIAA